jgi:serine/threonine-protein kinase
LRSDLTRTGVGLGTPGYLAPEVMEGGQADERSDLYALAVVAYQLLVGQPFKASAGSLPPDRVRPEVPTAISAAVMRALSRRPDDRQPSVARFLEDLAAARAEQTRTLVAAAAGSARPVSKGRRRTLIAAGLVALGAALVLGAMLAFGRLERPAASPLPKATPSTAARPAPQATRPRSAEPPRIDDSEDRRGDRGDSPKGSKSRGKGHKKKKEG